MNFEHVGLNVAEPLAAADWYAKHLGLTIVRRMDKPPFTVFLADSDGTMLVEFYRNPPDQVPPYATMNPLLLHLAFVSANPAADKERLLRADATFVEEVHLPDGSHLVMLRDPWGLALQLCKRGTPMRRTL
jgi:catechol 2,3-dioxygenase-like lactoylglutathione lyase family enzyme